MRLNRSLIINQHMKIACSVVFLAFLVSGLHLEKSHRRKVSKECCDLKGGFQCGNFQTDCCVVPQNTPPDQINTDLCIKGGFLGTSQYCPGQTITQQCPYCHNYCAASNGIMCGLSATDKNSCCSPQNCILNIELNLRMKKCRAGSQIELPDCVNDMSFSDELFGMLENVA